MKHNFDNLLIDDFTNKTLDLKEFDFKSAVANFANNRLNSLGIHKLVIITSALWDELQKTNSELEQLRDIVSNISPKKEEPKEEIKTEVQEKPKTRLAVGRSNRKKQ